MDDNQKRPASPASSEPLQKAARPSSPADESSWCMQCWKHPDDKCSGDKHHVLPLQDAKLEARKALDDAHRAWEARQQQLATVEEAGEPTVLKLTIPGAEGEDSLYLDGGSMMIRMAVTGALTEEEKEKVIEALKGHSVGFNVGESEESEQSVEDMAALGSLDDSRIASVIQKLPLCVDGQKLPGNAILYYSDLKKYAVYDKPSSIDKDQVRRKVRVFGWVTNDFSLRTERDCEYEYNPKYHTPSEEPIVVQVEDVEFVDRSLMQAHCSPPEREY